MDFVAVVDQVIALLRQRGRVTYSTLKRQFQLDEAALEDVKNELIEGQRLAVDELGNVLVWTGDTQTAPSGASTPVDAPVRAPLSYTPPYLAEKILTSKSALEGERKLVTVLFADLKGSTELIRDLDPEVAQRLLDPALRHMMDAVHRFEGTVNQVLGDGIMALFGAPVAHEDHAVRACYAALAMQAAMRRYAEDVRRSHGLEMQARVGLNSGEVVVRAIGNDLHMDYSAVGQTTHLAARMEQLATPGSIRLTAATLRLAEGLVQVNALGPVPVRGLTEPVEVFELVGASTIRGRLQASAARGLTRFVGRQQELAVLQQELEQAGAGQGQVVAIVGEAGVGKSRLVYELIHSHRTQGWCVLDSASVSYGKATPYFPVLHAIAEVPEEALYRGLGQLQAAEFLYETRLFPEREYMFTHALTHEVAYSSLLQERRRVLHTRIVEALETLAGDRVTEQVERLAQHALRGEVWDKALVYARQAGDKATTRSAFHEAMAYWEQALTALPHLAEQQDTRPQAIDLRLELDNVLLVLGDPGERGMMYLRQAETLAEALGDQRRLGRMYNAMSHHCWRLGDHDTAIAYAQRALTAASGDAFQQARALGNLGTYCYSLGDYRRAIDVLRQSLAILEGALRHTRSSMMVASVRTRCWLANCLGELGEFAEGSAYAAEAVRIAEEAAHLSSAIFAQSRQGGLALRQGDLPHALPILERALTQGHAADIQLFLPGITASLGLAYALAGRVTEALPLLTQAVMSEDNASGGSSAMLRVSETYLLTGRLEEARALAERALALVRTRQERGHQAYARWLLGAIAMQHEPPEHESATVHYRQALALAEELGMRPLQAHCHRGLGTLYAATGQHEQARAELSTAIAMYQAMEMTFWLPATGAALAQVEGREWTTMRS